MKADVYGYLQMKEGIDSDIDGRIDQWLNQTFKGKYLYKELAFDKDSMTIEGLGLVESHSLKKILSQSEKVIVFAVTLGADIDYRLEQLKYSNHLDMMILDAVASAQVEGLADQVSERIKNELGGFQTPRYSPGYGDFSLTYQKKILSILEARRIGLSANDHFLLTPSKSITGLIGISSSEMSVSYDICDDCLRRTTCDRKLCRRTK